VESNIEVTPLDTLLRRLRNAVEGKATLAELLGSKLEGPEYATGGHEPEGRLTERSRGLGDEEAPATASPASLLTEYWTCILAALSNRDVLEKTAVLEKLLMPRQEFCGRSLLAQCFSQVCKCESTGGRRLWRDNVRRLSEITDDCPCVPAIVLGLEVVDFINVAKIEGLSTLNALVADLWSLVEKGFESVRVLPGHQSYLRTTDTFLAYLMQTEDAIKYSVSRAVQAQNVVRELKSSIGRPSFTDLLGLQVVILSGAIQPLGVELLPSPIQLSAMELIKTVQKGQIVIEASLASQVTDWLADEGLTCESGGDSNYKEIIWTQGIPRGPFLGSHHR